MRAEATASEVRGTVKKPVRLISGVHVVSVSLKPGRCLHGRCLYCPGGEDQGTPQSYLSGSPTIARAIPLDYDPWKQVHYRLSQYVAMGHEPTKIELIILGGTFLAYPRSYLEWFVKSCFEAMNHFPKPKPPRLGTPLSHAHAQNEKAKVRCVGLTVETRPDLVTPESIDFLLKLGTTRVEIGVQTVYDDVLERVKRGHTVADVIRATKLLKDAGLKVCYHMMPGLPGSDERRDMEAFRAIFSREEFKPDMLKIYPTLVIPGTELYEMWKRGKYEPLSTEKAVELVAKVKAMVPYWVRINRVQRDLPVSAVAAGVDKGNLRQLVKEYMERRGMECRCIRCREVGHKLLKGEVSLEELESAEAKLFAEKYEASGGLEYFLSFETDGRKVLFGFLRLRKPSEDMFRPEVDERTVFVRELHVYGPEVPVGRKAGKVAVQHKGYGRKLMEEAEKIAAEELDAKKVLVTSGVGVRAYYRKLGYRRYRNSFYMAKRLS